MGVGHLHEYEADDAKGYENKEWPDCQELKHALQREDREVPDLYDCQVSRCL